MEMNLCDVAQLREEESVKGLRLYQVRLEKSVDVVVLARDEDHAATVADNHSAEAGDFAEWETYGATPVTSARPHLPDGWSYSEPFADHTIRDLMADETCEELIGMEVLPDGTVRPAVPSDADLEAAGQLTLMEA